MSDFLQQSEQEQRNITEHCIEVWNEFAGRKNLTQMTLLEMAHRVREKYDYPENVIRETLAKLALRQDTNISRQTLDNWLGRMRESETKQKPEQWLEQLESAREIIARVRGDMSSEGYHGKFLVGKVLYRLIDALENVREEVNQNKD